MNEAATPGGTGMPEAVAQPRHVLDHRDHVLAGDPHLDRPPVREQGLHGPIGIESRPEPVEGLLRRRSSSTRERSGGAEQVEQLLGGARPDARC